MYAEDFNNLPIDNSYIIEIFIHTHKVLVLDVIGGPFDLPASVTGKVCRIYRLEFGQLRNFRLGVHADPWLDIISHTCPAESDFLDSYRKKAGLNEELVFHFQIVCSEGTIDIIAAEFSSSLKEEMPHVGREQTNG
jgi:hypothetical protein